MNVTHNFCQQFEKAGFKCIAPEVNALRTDIIIISTHLEYAIASPYHKSIIKDHTPHEIKKIMISNLEEATEWFGDIIMYLKVYQKPGLNPLIEYVKKIKNYMPQIINTVESGESLDDLRKIAMHTIYGFQGVMGALNEMIEQNVGYSY